MYRELLNWPCNIVPAYLLFEVPSVLFIDEYEIQIISDTEPLVHFAESWCKIKASEEQPNRDCLSWYS